MAALRSSAPWLALAILSLILACAGSAAPGLIRFPEAWNVPVAPALNTLMSGLTGLLGPSFRTLNALLNQPLVSIQAVLAYMPWAVTALAFLFAALFAGGWPLAAFATASIAYIVGIGLWDESMVTLSIIVMSVPAASLIGFGLGLCGFYLPSTKRGILAALDVLQTIPTFAYLLTILILFGFGTVVGLVASVIYAIAPMTRNTLAGLERVPPTLVDAGRMSGATESQLFWQVRMPAARRQILLGVNQTTMACFSMVIVAAIIGGTSDIGWEVLRTIRKAEFGESVLAGLVIVLLAVLLDRIAHGIAVRPQGSLSPRPWHVGLACTTLLAAFALSLHFPALDRWPTSLQIFPAAPINALLSEIVLEHQAAIASLKSASFFYLMLPIKIGLMQAVSPFSWGITFGPPQIAGYLAVLAIAVALLIRTGRGAWAGAVGVAGAILLVGLTNTPWPALSGLIILGAYKVGGRRLASGTLAGLFFLLSTGIWQHAVVSLYLCGIAVLICVFIGGLIGIAAAQSDILSRLLRPILDTLQTMPLFIFLIPYVMIFKIGEFTALLAIITYAIVPASAIRNMA